MPTADPYAAMPDTSDSADPYANLPDTSADADPYAALPDTTLPDGFEYGQNGTILENIGGTRGGDVVPVALAGPSNWMPVSVPKKGNLANVYPSLEALRKELMSRGDQALAEQINRQASAKLLQEQAGPMANVVAGAAGSIDSTRRALGIGEAGESNASRVVQEASQELSPGIWGDIQRGAGGLAADIPLMLAGGPLAEVAGGLLRVQQGGKIVRAMVPTAAAVQPLAAREGLTTAQEHGAAAGLGAWAIETAVPALFGKTGAEKAIIGKMPWEQAAPAMVPRVRALMADSGMEATEEVATEVAHAIHEWASGMDPQALDPARLARRVAVAGALGGAAGVGFNAPGAIADAAQERDGQQRAVALDALRNLGGEVEAPATADPIQVDERTAALGKTLAPILGPEEVAREEAGRAIEASAANDTAIRRQRLARALGDEAADISADRRAGMESLAKEEAAAERRRRIAAMTDEAADISQDRQAGMAKLSQMDAEAERQRQIRQIADDAEELKRAKDSMAEMDLEAERQREVRRIADEQLRTDTGERSLIAAEGRAPDVAETPEDRQRFDVLEQIRQETDRRHQVRLAAIVGRRREGQIGKPQAGQEKAASEAQRAREYAEAAQAVADGQPLPSWSALSTQEATDAQEAPQPGAVVAPGPVPVPGSTRAPAAPAPQAAPVATVAVPAAPTADAAGKVTRRARVVPIPNGQGFRVAISDGAQPVRFLRPGSQPVAAQEAQAFATAAEAEQAARSSLGDRWDVGMSDQARRTSEQAQRDADMQKAQQEAGDQAVATIESRAREILARSPNATHYDLMREMSDFGFRVDKSQALPPGADDRGLRLRQALAQRGEDLRGMFDRIKAGIISRNNPVAKIAPENTDVRQATAPPPAKPTAAPQPQVDAGQQRVPGPADPGERSMAGEPAGSSPRPAQPAPAPVPAPASQDGEAAPQVDRNGGTGMTEDQAAAPVDDGVPFSTDVSAYSTEHGAIGTGSIMPAKPPADDKGEIRPLRKLIEDLADWIGAATYTRNKARRKGWLGYYDPASSAVVMRKSTDLNTWAHELSHWLDDRFGVTEAFQSDDLTGKPDLGDGPLDAELANFWGLGSKPPGNLSPAAKANYIRGEGFAEFLRAWMINPEAARRAAPLTAAHVQATVPADVLERLQSFGMDVRRFYHAPASESAKANIRGLGDTGPTLRERMWSSLFPPKGRAADPLQFGVKDWLRVRLTSRLHPLTKAIRYAGKITGRAVNATRAESLIRVLAGVNDKVHAIANNGMIRAKWIKDGKIQRADGVGGGMDWLLGWANTANEATMRSDLRALDVYLVSQSVVEQADNIDNERADFVAEQMKKIEQEHQDRLMTLEEMAAKVEAQGERRKRQVERHTAGRIDDVRTASEKVAAGADADVADMIDRGKAKDRPASAARARMAKRGDALTRSVLDLYGAIDATSADINRETETQIRHMQQRVANWYQAKLIQLARVSNRMAARDRRRKANLSGQGGGLIADDTAARKALDEIMANPELRARLEEGAKRYRAWAMGVLTYLRDKGRMSAESFRDITAKNVNYAAMNRVMDDTAGFRPIGGGKVGVAKETVHGRTGSTRTIDNPMANLMENTARSVAEADRNEAMLAVVDLLRESRGMHDGEATDLGSVAQRVDGPGDGAVTVFRNGEPEYWKFNEHIEAAIKGITEQYNLPEPLTFLAKVLRAGVTNSPDFAVRNRIRDIFTRLIIGQVNPKTAAGWLARLAKQVPGFNRLDAEQKAVVEMSGSAFAGHYMRGKEDWHKALQSRVRELRKDKSVIVTGLSALPRAYMGMVRSSEFSGRADEWWGLFNQLRKEGVDEETAALMAARGARDLVDFAESGTWIGTASQMVPFLNAAVQGVRAGGIALGRDPKGVLARWAIFAAMPSIAAYALAAARGDDDREEYANLPPWRRDLFWNIKVGPDTWVAIPKPFELGVLGTGAERLVQSAHDASQGRDPSKAFDGAVGSIAGALIPVDHRSLMVAFAPLVEVMTNTNAFTGKAIVPDYEKRKPVDQREGAQYASRLGHLGQFLSFDKADPRQVDHLVRGIFGSLGGLATGVSDIGRDDKAGQVSRIGMQMSGVLKRGAGDQQTEVQDMIENEQKAGRPNGKAIQRIAEMKRGFYQAGTGSQRDAIAKSMREYASGEDPRFLLDRALSAANQLAGAIEDLEPAARPAFIKAHADELRIHGALRAIGSRLNAMQKRGMSDAAMRAEAKAALDKIRARPKGGQVLGSD